MYENLVDAAVVHDLRVFSEKPIADTLEASVRTAEEIEQTGLKIGVTMSHRFDRDRTALRREPQSGDHGPVDYLVGRFTCSVVVTRWHGYSVATRELIDVPVRRRTRQSGPHIFSRVTGGSVERLRPRREAERARRPTQSVQSPPARYVSTGCSTTPSVRSMRSAWSSRPVSRSRSA